MKTAEDLQARPNSGYFSLVRAFGFTLGIVAIVSGTAFGAWLIWGPPRPVRVTLGDGDVVVNSPTDPRLSEAVSIRAASLLRSTTILVADDQVHEVTLAELGYSVDEEAFLDDARAAVASAQTEHALFSAERAVAVFTREPAPAAVFIPLELDKSRAREVLGKWATAVERDPIDAELRISEHAITKSEPGRRLSVETSLLRLERVAVERGLVVPLDVETVAPAVSEQDLLPVDVTRVLASYETSFRGKAGARAINIRMAARFLDGAVILPGEELSFNNRVGRRLHGRGFVDAPVIVNDELEQDVGGGVCQVATTLHAASVFGNLVVVKRRSHSRPSGYAPLGLDATVIDGEVDLKIRNPYDEPLLVHAWISEPFKVRVEILGRDPDVQVEHAYSVTSREPYARRVWFRENLAAGSFEKKQKGSEGMDVVSVVQVKKRDGTVARRSYSSKYYPVPEVFWVGPSVAPGELPPLPEGAAGVVIDGNEMQPAGDRKPPSPEDVPRLEETAPHRL